MKTPEFFRGRSRTLADTMTYAPIEKARVMIGDSGCLEPMISNVFSTSSLLVTQLKKGL